MWGSILWTKKSSVWKPENCLLFTPAISYLCVACYAVSSDHLGKDYSPGWRGKGEDRRRQVIITVISHSCHSVPAQKKAGSCVTVQSDNMELRSWELPLFLTHTRIQELRRRTAQNHQPIFFWLCHHVHRRCDNETGYVETGTSLDVVSQTFNENFIFSNCCSQ